MAPIWLAGSVGCSVAGSWLAVGRGAAGLTLLAWAVILGALALAATGARQ